MEVKQKIRFKELSELCPKSSPEEIELLYGNDSELLSLINNGRSEDKWNYSTNISMEDEVLNNLFLLDYYEELDKLPEIERQVLLKSFDENGMPYMKTKEIVAELGITKNQFYSVKTKALKRLSQNPKLQSYNKV